ncbi:MAG: MFS transporter [Pseudomonadota bacterium]
MAQPYTEPCAKQVIAAGPHAPSAVLPEAQRRWVLAACVLASSMAFIDGSALTVALPALKSDFGADLAAVQWVINGYALALAALTLIGGALADQYGKARMLQLGAALFGASSVACAIAPTVEWLIAARVLQGVSAALLVPASLALIGASYPQSERNRAIGVWAAASALTTAGGPVIGGWLTEVFGWEGVFWINPPLAAAVIIILSRLAAQCVREVRRFDVVGAALIASALFALAWGLSAIGPGEGEAAASALSVSMNAEVFLWLAASLAGLVAFVLWEQQTAAPMVPMRLFARRDFAGLNAVTLGVYGALSVMFFLVPFELVERRGLSAAMAGASLLPFTLGVGLLSRVFGGIADTIGAKAMIVAGSLGAAFAFALFAALATQSLIVGILVPMAVLGVSFAVIVAPLTAAVMSSASEAEEGLASGINNTASRIAQMIGVAAAAGIGSVTGGYTLGMWLAAALALVAAGIALTIGTPRQSA